MKSCPYCLAEIPAEAKKCMHCGEWVEQQPAQGVDQQEGERSFGEAANKYVDYQIKMSRKILPFVIIMMIIFLAVFVFIMIYFFNFFQNFGN